MSQKVKVKIDMWDENRNTTPPLSSKNPRLGVCDGLLRCTGDHHRRRSLNSSTTWGWSGGVTSDTIRLSLTSVWNRDVISGRVVFEKGRGRRDVVGINNDVEGRH